MARTENVYLTGTLSWVRDRTPDEWGNYKATIHPDSESLEKVRELAAEGVKNVIKKDENGYYVTYKRPVQKMINGKVVGFIPVILLDGSQKLPDGSFAPMRDVNVGNGSTGVMKLQVYEHRTPGGGKAKAARLESIRVDNLVPFQSKAEFSEEELRITKGLDQQPDSDPGW